MKTWLAILALITLPVVAADSPQAGRILSAPGGRFVFGSITGDLFSTFMLDTQTGRLWKYSLIGEKEEKTLSLVPVVYTVADGSVSLLPVDPTQEWELVEKIKALKSQAPEKDKTNGK